MATSGATQKGPAVVLAHGLIGWGAQTAARMSGRPYFNKIEQHLRSRGLRVLAPEVDGLATSSVRGAQLLEHIRKWPERLPGERVIVIGHSQGGLDARWAISRGGGDGLIHQLLTLSTPHHGTALCEHVAQPLLRGAPGALQGAIEALCVPMELARFMSTPSLKEFNEACPDSPDVRYLSLGGGRERLAEYWAPFMAITPVLAQLEPGPNDGLVSAASARWGEYVGTLACDHVDLLNFPLKAVHKAPMEPLWDYLASLATVGEQAPPPPPPLALRLPSRDEGASNATRVL